MNSLVNVGSCVANLLVCGHFDQFTMISTVGR